jgi:hypothetical protein
MTETPAVPHRAPRRRGRALLIATVVASAAVLGYASIDLYFPHSSDIRAFDPDEVARLDTAMWRAYYDRERVRLFLELAQLLRTQYGLPFLRSNVVAYRAAHAAFVFKDGHERADYERALPDLVAFYAALRDVSTTPFDADEAARLELEWWIVHRERDRHAEGDLARALAELGATIYGVPAERLAVHARLRAEAMTIRDTKADAGGVTEVDWARIDALLRASWRSLHDAVQP